MGLFSKDIRSMDDLFVHTLQDIYYAEKQIERARPKMVEKASAPELREGLASHLEQTHQHVARLEQVFQMHGKSPKGVTCPAIDGIIAESPEEWADFCGGDDKRRGKLQGFFVGKVMKATRGQADGKAVNAILDVRRSAAS